MIFERTIWRCNHSTLPNPIIVFNEKGGSIMEPDEAKLKALDESFEVLCKTNDPTQWIEAFEAAYGEKPVYIPQH